MDNLTHSLFGLTLARTPIGRVGTGTTTALLLASNLPDIDIVVTLTGGAARYLSLHRGPTHGPLGIALLSIVAAAIGWIAAKSWSSLGRGDPPGSVGKLWAVSAVGVFCHVLMDLPTSYGTRPLSPFSWTWFTLDWMPIVDVYLLAILAGGLVLGSGSVRRRRTFAAGALALMAANYGVRAAAHHAALEVAEPPQLFAREWCPGAPAGGLVDRWPLPSATEAEGSPEPCVTELVAIPDFLSPLKWRVIARLPGEYRATDVNLAARFGSRSALASNMESVPNGWDARVRKAAATPSAQVFLGFSRLPAVRVLPGTERGARVRWFDLRFTRNENEDRIPLRRSLFGATVDLDAAGAVLSHRLGS